MSSTISPVLNGVLNPIHPDMLGRLDEDFITLYNNHVAEAPDEPIDLAVLRSMFSVRYSCGTGPAPDVARIYVTTVAIGGGVDLGVRVYEPSAAGPSPVHIDIMVEDGASATWTQRRTSPAHLQKGNVAVIDVPYRTGYSQNILSLPG